MAKIAQIQPQGTVQMKDGSSFFKFQITLDDNRAGEVLAKTEDRWSVGDEVEAEVKNTDYGVKLKLSKPQSNYSGGYSKGGMSPEKEKRITFLSCLSSAASFHAQSSVTPEQVVETAKKFANAAYSLEAKPAPAPKPAQPAPSAFEANDNDLPF